MSVSKFCFCGHTSGYHKPKQHYVQRGPQRIYVGKSFLECQMDGCDCEKFKLKKAVQVAHNMKVENATD
ncbi:MAG: hypothetical protein ACW99F_03355 [Candidatus Hodarchaeales archaeon]|jgi:hypothetical protein